MQALTAPGVLACWAAVASRATCRGDTLWCPLPPSGGNRLQALLLGMRCGDLAGRPKHLSRPPTHNLPEWRWRQTVVLTSSSSLEGARGFPAFSTQSLSCLLFRSCSFSSQLSPRSNCCLHTHTFGFAHGRGEFRVPLCRRHLAPPSLSSL